MRSFGVLMAVLTPLLLYNVIRILFPTVESREPPILRPKIPFFGHVISLICENTRMFDRL